MGGGIDEVEAVPVTFERRRGERIDHHVGDLVGQLRAGTQDSGQDPLGRAGLVDPVLLDDGLAAHVCHGNRDGVHLGHDRLLFVESSGAGSKESATLQVSHRYSAMLDLTIPQSY